MLVLGHGVVLRYRFSGQPQLVTVDTSSDYEPMYVGTCVPKPRENHTGGYAGDFDFDGYDQCIAMRPTEPGESCKYGTNGTPRLITNCSFQHGPETHSLLLQELENVFPPAAWRLYSAGGLQQPDDHLNVETETFCRLFTSYDDFTPDSLTFDHPRHCWGAGLSENPWAPSGLDDQSTDDFLFDVWRGCDLGLGFGDLSSVDRTRVCGGRVGDTDPLIIAGFRLDTELPPDVSLASLAFEFIRGYTVIKSTLFSTPYDAGIYTLGMF